MFLAANRQNMLPFSEELNQWIDNLGLTVTANAMLAPDGTYTADVINVTSGTRYLVSSGVSDSAKYIFSYYIHPSDPSTPVFMYTTGAGNGSGFINLQTGQPYGLLGTAFWAGSKIVRDGWYRVWLTIAPSSNNLNMACHVWHAPVAGQNIGIWGMMLNDGETLRPYFKTTSDFINGNPWVVELNPEWDYEDKTDYLESSHQAYNGSVYTYRWGKRPATKFGLKYVESGDAHTLNTWWRDGTTLTLHDEHGLVVMSGRIVGDVNPVTQRINPYMDKFSGIINLESF